MQNVPGGQSSFSGRAGYVSHTRSATHQIQPATGLGQQPGATGYSSLDLTAAFPFIDPATQTLTGYATGAAAPHAINESYPCQLADPLYAYQPGGEILEQFMFPNLHPMVPLPEAAAGPPALTHGTYGGHGQQPMISQPATLRCKWEGCAYSGTFNRREELLRHVKNIHISPQSYQCDTCGQRFNQSYNREVHMRRHRMRGVSRG